MKKRGWNQSDLAKRAGVRPHTINHVLHRRRKPGPELCRGIARALGYDECFVFWKAGLIRRLPPHHDPDLARLRQALDRLPPQAQHDLLEDIFALVQTRLQRHHRSHPNPFRTQRNP